MLSKTGKGGITVTVVKDSVNSLGNRITTFELEYHRFIHSELMTHRCLSGSTMLSFDLPSGKLGSDKRKYEMSIQEFYTKWVNGSSERNPSRFKKYDLNKIDLDKVYTAKDVALLLGMASPSNIRGRCRTGRLPTQNPNKSKSEDHLVLGSDVVNCYSEPSSSSFSLKNRLKDMRLRMLNEDSNEIEHTTITDIWEVGEKETYLVKAGDKSISATLDHLVLTSSGWKEVGDLTTDDYLITCGFGVNERTDANRLKKIDGQWVSVFNKNVLSEISMRQGHKCYNCGENKKLEVHHLEPVSKRPDLAFDIGNVVAVCNHCHKNVFHAEQDWQVSNMLIGKPEKIESIVFDKIEKVYDLSVASDFHNFVANDIIVHNCFSRNAMSSRAVPIEKMIEQVRNNPATPIHWGANQSGMQANEECSEPVKVLVWEDSYDSYSREDWWRLCANEAANSAEAMSEAGYHKQIVNRILEPYQFMKTVVTATEYDNFFELRCHKDAQPEIQELANLMKELYELSIPDLLGDGEWHLPYVDKVLVEEIGVEDSLKVSASCCAQVSYRLLDNSVEKALKVYDRLVSSTPIHASPFEHQAKVPVSLGFSFKGDLDAGMTHYDLSGNYWSGNFKGWIQYRQML